MTGGRPRLAIGTFGNIEFSPTPTGWRARTWVRDLDGKRRRAQATDRTARKAEALLKDRIRNRPGYGSGGMLSLSSTFDELCELWLADLAKRDLSQGTKDCRAPGSVEALVCPGFRGVGLLEARPR